MLISEDLQNKLRQKYNPDGSNLREYQLYLVQLLQEFDKICKQIGVNYWISQGTVLGAIRHGGFIPWDDDIDVEMTYADYCKFCRNFQETNNHAVQNIMTDPYYPLPFAKFRDKNKEINDTSSKIVKRYKYKGAFIDIFYTEYRFVAVSKFINYFFVASAKCGEMIKNDLAAKAMIKLFKYCGYSLSLLFRSILKWVPGKTFGLGYGSHFYYVESSETDIFPLNTIEFEGIQLPAPNNIDKYLKKIYGNYKELPSLEKIKTHIGI